MEESQEGLRDDGEAPKERVPLPTSVEKTCACTGRLTENGTTLAHGELVVVISILGDSILVKAMGSNPEDALQP